MSRLPTVEKQAFPRRATDCGSPAHILSDAPQGSASEPVTQTEILAYLKRFGRNTNSFLLGYGSYQWFRSQSPPGLVGYLDRGRTLVVATEPLCESQHTPAVLLALAREAGPRRRIVLVGAGHWLLPVLDELGYGRLEVGRDAFFDLGDWGPRGDRAKKVRSPVNRARKAGVTVEQYRPGDALNPDIERRIQECCEAWLGTRPANAMGFLVGLDPLKLATERRYFLAWHRGELAGFVTASPIYARNGWYIEDVVWRPDGPYGVTEFLVTAACQSLRDEGAEVATLGLAPSFDRMGKEGGIVRRVVFNVLPVIARPFYDFTGLERYKKKYAPSWWEPVYVAFWPDRISIGAIIDVIRAFTPNGIRSMAFDYCRDSVRSAIRRLCDRIPIRID